MPDESLRHPLPGGAHPEPMDIFQDTWKEFSDDLGPYILAGLGQLVVTIPVMMVLFFVVYFGVLTTLFGGIFLGAIAGAVTSEAVGPEAGGAVFALSYAGSIVLMFVVILGLSMLVGAIMAPLNASMVRRVAEHQRGGRKLDFTAPFSDAGENLMGVILGSLLVGGIVLVGFLFCYLPGIIAAFMLIYAGTLVALKGLPPLAAVRASYQNFMEFPQFHLVFSLLYLGCGLLASYVPIVGPMFVMAAHVRAHRTLFGDPDTGPELLTAA